MNVFSSISTWLSGISVTMEMLVIFSLAEFLMLAVIGLVYLFRKNKVLKNVIVKLKIRIQSKKSGQSQLQQVTTYLQEQIALSELQYETLSNCKDPDEYAKKYSHILSGRLTVLNSELLTLPEYIDHSDNYWASIYARYAELTSSAEHISTDDDNHNASVDAGSVEALEEIEAIDEKLLLSLGDLEGENHDLENHDLENHSLENHDLENHSLENHNLGENSLEILEAGDDQIKASIAEASVEQETPELNLKDTASEEIGRLRDIISRQYHSIDTLKLSITDIQDLSKDEDNQALNSKFTELKRQTDALLDEQEQFSMCINVLEQENLRLSEEILQTQSESDANRNNDGAQEKAQSQSVMKSLVQTNKEQLQCISILENEIKGLKSNQSNNQSNNQGNNQNDKSSNASSDAAGNSEKINATIDELKFKLSDRNSEMGLLREEYDTLKQKYVAISRKVAEG